MATKKKTAENGAKSAAAPAATKKTAAAKKPLAVVILAAGKGKRMRSARAKVLHEVAGRSLIEHVVGAAETLKPERIVAVVGHQAEDVTAALGDRVRTALQAEQLGTGHALAAARPALRGFAGDLLVLCGDVPLVTPATLKKLVAAHRRAGAEGTVASMLMEDPTGYGRVVRGTEAGHLRIVEHGDASHEELHIDEVNSGLYCFDAAFVLKALGKLGTGNAQGEYYLTDVIEMASTRGTAACWCLEDATEAMGVNSRLDLARAEAVYQERELVRLMESGVTFLDPPTAYLSADTKIGADTVIGPNVRLEGRVRIGRDCRLEGNQHLKDTEIGDGVLLRWGIVTDGARVGAGAKLGPFAHLRPEADLADDVHIGNFVEVKKSRIGRGSKANHLAYIGDATVGEDSNIGAGTITCNYDGFAKHRTTIGSRVQIGSDTQLVAPVTIGDDVFIAAGSTIGSDVEPFALAFNDKRQRVRAGWVHAFRKRVRKK